MRNRILILLMAIIFSAGLDAQQPGVKHIRIADTLTVQEKSNRNPIILRAELDSLIKVYSASQEPQVMKEPSVVTKDDNSQYMLIGLIVLTGLIGLVVFMIWNHQQKINKTIEGLNKETQPSRAGKERVTKGKLSPQLLETKIGDLNAELHKLSKENEGLSRVIKEYNGIQHEYDSLKHGMQKAYKVKNYPGYDKSKDEALAIQGVLETENMVASYAYEKFLKPILGITDANKNSPARLSANDRERLMDLLVSLSLLYIEYLYLRINDLSIGGKMVERIKGFSNGNGVDTVLLKKLNTEFGSRALVIKMALEKTGVTKLSYPVFDETNLNNQ
ncbi:MAG: hypothetical protein HOP10_11190 [Chitinophagaceae bacterium]|nr:hypothetical protein [Chitinophagaceae bacterium]